MLKIFRKAHLFHLFLLLFFIQPSSAQGLSFISNVDESKIRPLTGEEIYILDAVLNYERISKEIIEKYALLFFADYVPEADEFAKRGPLMRAEKEINEVIKSNRFKSSFDYILQGSFYLGEYDFESQTFPVLRKGSRIIPKNILVGKTSENYSFYYTVISTHPESLSIGLKEQLGAKLVQKFNADGNVNREVGVTLHIIPEMFTFAPQRGYIPVRVIQADVWYVGEMIGSQIFNEVEETITSFSIKGTPITTKWRLVNGRPEGMIKSYYPNNQVYCQGYYYEARTSAKQGKFEFFDLEGRLFKEENYETGDPDGRSYEIYYGSDGISSISFKFFARGILECQESINIFNGQIKRTSIANKCIDSEQEKLFKELGIETKMKAEQAPSESATAVAKSELAPVGKASEAAIPPVTKNLDQSASKTTKEVVAAKAVAVQKLWMALEHPRQDGCFHPHLAFDSIVISEKVEPNQLVFISVLQNEIEKRIAALSIFTFTDANSWTNLLGVNKLLVQLKVNQINVVADFDQRAPDGEKKLFSAIANVELKLINPLSKREVMIAQLQSKVVDKVQRQALDKLLQQLSSQIMQKLYLTQIAVANVISVKEMNSDFTPKVVVLDNAAYIIPDESLQFYLVDESDLKLNGGGIAIEKIVGMAQFGTKVNQEVFCTVISGGKQLKQSLERGRKIMAVSAQQYQSSEKQVVLTCLDGAD
jgi:hypothetical protein